jgi:hypothetical protein
MNVLESSLFLIISIEQCGIGIAFIANAIKELENNNQIVKRSIKKNTHLQFLIYHNKYQ